jgi:hypothetical protein
MNGQGMRDLILQFLRTVPGPLCIDDDLILAEVRDGIDGQGSHGTAAQDSQQREQSNDENSVSEGGFDNAIDHGAVGRVGSLVSISLELPPKGTGSFAELPLRVNQKIPMDNNALALD